MQRQEESKLFEDELQDENFNINAKRYAILIGNSIYEPN